MAVEENLEEEKTSKNPTAYFVSFLGLLDQAISGDNVLNKDLATSALYFLDLVSPYTPPSLLRGKFVPILSKVTSALTDSDAEAPILKSSIGVLETLLYVQELNAWNVPITQASAKRGLLGLMTFGMDPRPKVRKRALDAVSKVLETPVTGSDSGHPAGLAVAESALQSMNAFLQEFQKRSKEANTENSSTQLLHVMKLVKVVIQANSWPLSFIEPLCHNLLLISKLSDKYLIASAFDLFESLFKSMKNDNNNSNFSLILDAIFDLTPSSGDQSLASSWFLAVSSAMDVYTSVEPLKALLLLPKIFNIAIDFFNSDNSEIQTSAAQFLIAICENSISQKVLVGTITPQVDEVLRSISDTVFGLLNIKYQECWKDVMLIVVSLSNSLMWKSDPYLIKSFKVIGTLRSTERFSDGWQEAEKVIGAAIRSLGPEKTLEMFPLNLDGSAQPSRPWMLPLLRQSIGFSNLNFFKTYFVNLSGQIEVSIANLKQENKSNATETQIKVYSTMIDQIWALFPSFCDLPLDLRDSFDQEFPKLLMNVVYQYTELRGYIFTGLKLLVESNSQYLEGAIEDNLQLLERFTKEEAKQNLEYLSTFSLNILASLFNVFAVTPIDSRVQLLECAKAYLSIISRKDLETTFNRVSTALSDSLKDPQAGANKDNDIPPTSTTMLDLIIQMAPFLPESSFNALLTIFVTIAKEYQEPLLQKRVYRLFTALSELDSGRALIQSHLENLIQLFLETSDTVQITARGPRLHALSGFTSLLTPELLYFIPAIVSEVVVATKDLNEKTREAAFALLVKMGQAMQQNGTIDRSKIPGMPADSESVQASLEEYITIIAAGLSDTTPHTQTATVLALSRVVFEFKDKLKLEFLKELYSAVEMLLDSRSKEVADATLGFVKVSVVSLPKDVFEPQLQRLIEHLLGWYREHSSHIRLKIKHLIERLLRIFGFDVIASKFPEDDMKFLNNIRKSKERAKRKKTQKVDEKEDENDESHRNRKHFAKTAKFESEFDRALYGSSSEDEESDEEMADSKKPAKKNNAKFIVEGADPLDLLDQKALAHVTSSKPSNKKRAIPEAKKFKRDADGRIIVKTPEDNDDPLAKINNSLNAYEEAVKSGPVRDHRGVYRYKRGRHNMDDADDMSDDEGSKKPKLMSKKNSGNANRGFKGSINKKKGQPGHRRFYN